MPLSKLAGMTRSCWIHFLLHTQYDLCRSKKQEDSTVKGKMTAELVHRGNLLSYSRAGFCIGHCRQEFGNRLAKDPLNSFNSLVASKFWPGFGRGKHQTATTMAVLTASPTNNQRDLIRKPVLIHLAQRPSFNISTPPTNHSKIMSQTQK